MKILGKLIPALLFWTALAFVIFQIPYPESLAQAKVNQIIPFFASLFLSLIFTINIFLKNILSSSSISLGLILLLILKALDSLNIVTTVLILIAIVLLLSYFKKAKKRNLSKLPKINKLQSL